MVTRRCLAAAAVLLAACAPVTRDPGVPPTPAAQSPSPTVPSPTAPAPAVPAPTAPQPSPGLSGDAWTPLADAPLALTEVAAAAFGGRVWVAGGLTEQGQASAAVLVYDPAADAWAAGPDLPEAVHHAALVATDAGLVLVGGYVGAAFDRPTAAVRRLDSDVGGWVDETPLPQARAAGAAAWDGRRIVYAGGVGPGGLAGDVVALEEGDGSGWRRLGGLTRPREHVAAASDGAGRTWVMAGRTGGFDTNLAVVDLVDGDEVRALGEVPTARGGVAAFHAQGLGGCVVGGEGVEGTFAEVECLSADGTVASLPPLGEARHGLGAAVVGDAVYVLLGGPEPGLFVSATVEGLRLPQP
jgi:hypothetical protein